MKNYMLVAMALILSSVAAFCPIAANAQTGEVSTSKDAKTPDKVDVEKMNFNFGGAEEGKAGGTVEVPVVNPEEVIARLGSEEIKMKDLLVKLDELPPYVPKDQIKKEDKVKMVEKLLTDKMLELAMKEKNYSESDKMKEVAKEFEKRLTLHFFVNDEVKKSVPEPVEADAKAFFEKNKELFQNAQFEQVKQNIVEKLKNDKTEAYFEEMFKKLAKEYELKTDEAVLAKVQSLYSLDSKELSLAIFKMKDSELTLGDIYKTLKLDELLSPGKPPVDIKDAQTCHDVIANVLKANVLIKNAIASGYTVDKNPKIKEELARVSSAQMKRFFIEYELLANISVKEEDKKKFYEEHKAEFKQDEQVKASHILVKEESQAKDIEKRLKEKDGKNFEEIAKAESTCPSKAQGGDLGMFGRGQMVKEFEDYAFTGEIGKLSPIIKTQFGYHIVKVTEKKAGKQLEYAEVADKLEARIKNDLRKSTFDKYFEELKNKYKMEIFNDKIK